VKVLVIGARGQLGTDLCRVFETAGDTLFPVTHGQMDVCSEAAVSKVITDIKPDVVLNTAAFHKVETCETQPETSFQVNAFAVLNLARTCKQSGSVLVHFSTDYVFDGQKTAPYEETDRPAPLNVYGASKLSGEHLIACSADQYFIIRTCGLYGLAGSSGKGGNFVENMLKKAAAGDTIRVVDDQVLTPTYTVDLARATRQLIQTGNFGLYHVTSEGQCSWYQFTRTIFDLAGVDASLKPVKTADFPSPVKRPSYSVLSDKKLRSLDISIPTWQDALARYLQQRPVKKPAQMAPTSSGD
jgi:dTDP-4-dehydrorhamnose reductase